MFISNSLVSANFFSTVLYVFVSILILLLMVLIHELGHYIAGRIFKFKIEEFSIGFGKKLWSKKNKRGEVISLRLFPLGGFCAFAGEEGKGQEDPNSFYKKKPWKRIIVLFAGAFFNFLSAILFSLILLCTVGFDVKQIDSVTSAQNTNLQANDVIVAVEGEKVDFAFSKNFSELLNENNERDSITLTLRRNGKIVYEEVSFETTTSSEGVETKVLGITVKNYVYNFWEALGRCVPFAIGLAWLVLKGLWLLITFRMPLNQIGGPITTVSTIATLTQQSFSTVLVLLPLIAANLAMFNLLPFPALDGSQIVFTSVEWIRKKPLNKNLINTINTFGLLFLIIFVICIDFLHFLA